MKITPVFGSDLPSAAAISFEYQRVLTVMRLISIYALKLIASEKLCANLP